jgi:hypothetical protein
MSDIPESQQVKVKGIVDLVFLMDATGSLEICIEQVKNNLRGFIELLTGAAATQAAVKEWRAKVVGFRDFEYDSEPLVDNPFTDDPAVLESQLTQLEAKGGGDIPESLLEGIYHCATMEQTGKGEPLSPDKWRNKGEGARVVIVFTDAPFKDPMEQPKGGTLDDLANVCEANRIILQVFAPKMDCYYELGEIDKADCNLFAYDEADPAGAAKALNEFTSEGGNFKATLEALAKTVTQEAATEIIE